tara:strand:+ start:1472 stop:2011 length:540 start_codon:yes stop_codon:yes gene_type:complete
MKILKILLILSILLLQGNTAMGDNAGNIYNFNFVDIDGNEVNLSKFEGKPLLLVNTASRCGFTPQYKQLQNLFLKYKETDLTIIATTSNSFNQEYSTSEEIKKFCLISYDAGFIVSSPIEVKGKKTHPIYSWLYNKYKKKPKWNFYKFLFDRKGQLVDSWSSITKPDDKKIINKIENLI